MYKQKRYFMKCFQIGQSIHYLNVKHWPAIELGSSYNNKGPSNREHTFSILLIGADEGTPRLVDLATTYQRVEVLYAGRWGSVCSTKWGVLDAEVVCRDLGRDIVAVGVAPVGFFTT